LKSGNFGGTDFFSRAFDACCHERSALRDEICRVGRSLFERGYVHATAGNISVRLDDGFLITPTDACLGTLDPARLARLDAAAADRWRPRQQDAGAAPPHLRRRPRGRCVIHTHSTHLVALTLQGVWSGDDILPPITPYFVMKVGHVPLIPYHRPGDPAAAELVHARIARRARTGAPIRAVMLDRLGPNVWHAARPRPARCWKSWKRPRSCGCCASRGRRRSTPLRWTNFV
jgi:ribulose-5-phosphate 4-epimerase/fuculose-1-phosphate aldolase